MRGELLQEPVRAHPFLVVDLAQVIAARVRQQHDDQRLRVIDLFGYAHGRHEGRPTRTADQDAFLARQTPRHEEALFVVDDLDAIDEAHVHRAGHEILTDTLDFVDLGRELRAGRVNRAGRIRPDNLYGRIVALEDA